MNARKLRISCCLALSAGWIYGTDFARAQDSADSPSDKPVMSQDITIRGKGGHGPALPPPPTMTESAVFNEILPTLSLDRKDYQDSASTQRPIRLLKKFPEPPYLLFSPESFHYPYNLWLFQVLQGDYVVKQLEGKGAAEARIGWDGTDMEGQLIARADGAYRIKFTGVQKDGQEHTVASSLISLGSMIYRPSLDHIYMDVDNGVLFPQNRPELLETAPDYLREMAARMSRHNPKDRPYHLVLYQKNPDSDLARARAGVLKQFLSTELLVHPKRIEVEIQPVSNRGDVTTAVAPSSPRGYLPEE